MPMRHPLKDLPLDSFLPLEHRTSSKRPLSPSAALLSPSKRRILSAEGLYSPEKRRNSTPSRHLYSKFVTSPSSPARRLDFAALSHPTPRIADFGASRHVSSPQTPVHHTGDTPKLAPSPEIASSSTSGTSSFPHRHCDPNPGSPRSNDPLFHMLIPREMPTFADRQSVHWPGFDVHPDTHVVIPTSQTNDSAPAIPDNHDEDDTKENVRPRRRGGKRSILEEQHGNPVRFWRGEGHAQEFGDVDITPMLTPSPEKRTLDPREREQGRRNILIMVRELDHEFNEEEDVEQQL